MNDDLIENQLLQFLGWRSEQKPSALDGKTIVTWWTTPDGIVQAKPPLLFLTDPRATLSLITFMRRKGWNPRIVRPPNQKWNVEFWREADPENEIEFLNECASADTFPRAVALAACRALKIPTE